MNLPDYDFTGKKVLIPDDILDGGKTFLDLSEMLISAGARSVDIYVTHLIASRGLSELKKNVNNLYAYHIIGDFINRYDVLRFNNE